MTQFDMQYFIKLIAKEERNEIWKFMMVLLYKQRWMDCGIVIISFLLRSNTKIPVKFNKYVFEHVIINKLNIGLNMIITQLHDIIINLVFSNLYLFWSF